MIMKKTLIFTNLLSIAIILWLYFEKKPIEQSPKCTSCNNCDAETTGQEFEHFRNVVYNYRVKHWDLINNTSDFNNTMTKNLPYSQLVTKYNSTDARCIWFPLETIKKFICTIEKYNNKLVNPSNSLGIRFYYAVYEDDYPDTTKQSRHTLFMTPTYQDGNGGPQVDFDPRLTYEEQTKAGGKKVEKVNYVTIGNKRSPYRLAGTKLLILGDESIVQNPNPTPSQKKSSGTSNDPNLIQNTGEMCPANCPTTNTLQVIDP